MKKMLLGGLVAAVVVVAGVALAAALRPDHFVVERSLAIAAPPERIYPLIADFHRWPAWSPYEALDPDMRREIGGAPSGVGATYAWSGDGKAGSGRMHITDARPPNEVVIALDFSEPMEAHNTATFTLAPVGSGTTLATWAMAGESPFVFKLMSLVLDVDGMIGRDFEAGLANLKRAAEAPQPE